MSSDAALKIVPPRTLANVLLDIQQSRIAWTRTWGDEAESAALDRYQAFQDEARAMIEAATGVPWDQISEACL